MTIPITLKFRAGWDESSLNYEQTARIAEAAGVNAIALHPRTKAQGYSGNADWERIAGAKRAVSIPVIGSGDVMTAEAALDRLQASGVDGIMIGRGAMANPWIFRQIEELRHGIEPFQPLPADKQTLLLRYLEMLVDFMPEHHATNKVKQLAGQFFVGLPGAAALRKNLQIAKASGEQREVILHYFAPFIDGRAVPSLTTEPLQEMDWDVSAAAL